MIGARAYRVIFALISLPLALTTVVYFINHRYSGTPLWNLQSVPGMHSAVWALSFISFFFLYPSTFNILEVAAVDKPKLHLWETGIMRVTRHPQVGGSRLLIESDIRMAGLRGDTAVAAGLQRSLEPVAPHTFDAVTAGQARRLDGSCTCHEAVLVLSAACQIDHHCICRECVLTSSCADCDVSCRHLVRRYGVWHIRCGSATALWWLQAWA